MSDCLKWTIQIAQEETEHDFRKARVAQGACERCGKALADHLPFGAPGRLPGVCQGWR